MFVRTIRFLATAAAVLSLAPIACGSDPPPSAQKLTAPPAPSPNASVKWLGVDDVTLTDGKSPEIGFDVPPDVISITASVVGREGEHYRICSWVAPDKTLVDEGWKNRPPNDAVQCTSCALYIRSHARVFGVTAPNTPTATVVPGTHRISVCGETLLGVSSASVRVAVFAKTLPQPPATGSLDLNFHFTGARGVDAAKAPTDPELAAAIEEVRKIFGQVGITIGRLTWSDVDAGYQVLRRGPNTFDPFSDVFALFGRAAGRNEMGVDVFFIDRYEDLGVEGYSGGIPGPPLAHAATGSGIVVALTGDPALGLGRKLAHELGHFLGLFHTDEIVDFLDDPLPDTPDKDDAYLMHYKPRGNKLSEWQGRILRSSPWIYH